MIFVSKDAILLSSRTYSFAGKTGGNIEMFIATLVDGGGKPFEARMDADTFKKLSELKNVSGQGQFDLRPPYAAKGNFKLYLLDFTPAKS